MHGAWDLGLLYAGARTIRTRRPDRPRLHRGAPVFFVGMQTMRDRGQTVRVCGEGLGSPLATESRPQEGPSGMKDSMVVLGRQTTQNASKRRGVE